MSKKQSNPLTEMQADPFGRGSSWADAALALGFIGLFFSISFFVIGLGGVSNEDTFFSILGPLFMGSIQLLVIGHLIKILANIRWFTYKTSEKRSSDPLDPSLFSSVVDELKKISEENKEQSEALKTSIEELSEKTDKTNAYLHHIYQNSTKAPPPPPPSS